MIGQHPIGASPIGSITSAAYFPEAPVIPPEPPFVPSGGTTTGRRRKSLKASSWTSNSPWTGAWDNKPLITLPSEPIEVSVPTLSIVVVMHAVSVEITEPVSVMVAVPRLAVHTKRASSGYGLRIPENPKEENILPVLRRLGLIP